MSTIEVNKNKAGEIETGIDGRGVSERCMVVIVQKS